MFAFASGKFSSVVITMLAAAIALSGVSATDESVSTALQSRNIIQDDSKNNIRGSREETERTMQVLGSKLQDLVNLWFYNQDVLSTRALRSTVSDKDGVEIPQEHGHHQGDNESTTMVVYSSYPEEANSANAGMSRALQVSQNEGVNMVVDELISQGLDVLQEALTKGITQVATKFVSVTAATAIGTVAGVVFSAVFMALSFIGEAVNRDKCKLACCPNQGLPGSWSCKYQTSKAQCVGFYADYPGQGDHSCFWNELEQRCEVGAICRDNTFSFFKLLGADCPPCGGRIINEPQYSPDALKNAGLPERFHVKEWGFDAGEFTWCALNGVRSCFDLASQYTCETSYADHHGDTNCQWYNGKCRPGKDCDDTAERYSSSQDLGLQYSHYAWRKASNNEPVDNYVCRWGGTHCIKMQGCPSGGGVGECHDVSSQYQCEKSYQDYYGDKFCFWTGSRCWRSEIPCHDHGIQLEFCHADSSVCEPSSQEPYTPPYKIAVDVEQKQVDVYGPYKDANGKYPLLVTKHICSTEGVDSSVYDPTCGNGAQTAAANMKCPSNHDDRLFRLADKTMDQCREECAGDSECNYYSFGTEMSDNPGVCMGCSSAENAEAHKGFNLYPAVLTNMKCPSNHDDRLYRLEGNTLDQCRDKCAATTSCTYYSFGTENYSGVCMGCTSIENAEVHAGFEMYASVALESVIQSDVKCPSNDEDRLFRLEDKTLEQCREECAGNRECNYYSFGTELSDHPGICMGCTSADNAKKHKGFNLYPTGF